METYSQHKEVDEIDSQFMKTEKILFKHTISFKKLTFFGYSNRDVGSANEFNIGWELISDQDKIHA